MTRRRWIADEVSGNRAVLLGAHAEHLSRVLRARVGQEFDISTDQGVRRGRITSIHEDRIEFELGEEVPAATELPVTLALSVFKFDRIEWAIEKCTELGVKRIVPVIASRTEAHLAAAATKRVERWRRIAREAAEQSRRAHSPDIVEPLKLGKILEMESDLRIVLAEFNASTSLKEALQNAAGRSILIAIGPEGGWTDAEHQAFTETGWIAASLGGTILRAETAAMAAMAVVVAELG